MKAIITSDLLIEIPFREEVNKIPKLFDQTFQNTVCILKSGDIGYEI